MQGPNMRMLGLMLWLCHRVIYNARGISSIKKCKKETGQGQAEVSVNEKSKSRRNHGVELDVMGDTSKVLNKGLMRMNDERQDDKDVLFGKLVAAELNSYHRGKSLG